MRTRAPLVLGCVAIVLAACSIDAVTYTPEPGALAENCAMPGDEDSNGLADCSDPTCAGAPACQAVCGDGVVEQGEQCDDGNLVEGDGCTRNCQVTAIYLKASNTGMGDQFGTVALSADGSTLAVGAASEASGIDGDQVDNSAAGAGAVYVFVRTGSTWIQQAYLKASNAGAGDQFGTRLALSADGSTLAVGAANEASAATGVNGDQTDNSAFRAGAVYVFVRIGSTWAQQAYLKASNAGAGDQFGARLALSGDGSTLAVGAANEASAATGVNRDQADNSASNAGAVYIFARSGATWFQEAYVKASNTEAGDEFGSGVAISGDGTTLAVGAHLEDSATTEIDGEQADNSVSNAGAVYVFRSSGTTWSQTAYVKASNTGSGDEFGVRLALSGDGSTLAVGAVDEDSAATGIGGDQADNSASTSGAAYVYRGLNQSALVPGSPGL